MKILFLLPLFFITINGVSAQQEADSVPARWGLKAGWTESHIYDRHTSPLLYQADVMNIGGLYQRDGAFLFEVALTVSIGYNRPQRLGKREAEITETPDIYGQQDSYTITAYPFLSMASGQLNVRALWSLDHRHRLGVSINARHIYTGMAIDDWHYTQVDLSPEYAFSYGILDGDVEASFSVPLLAGVVRPNYAFDPSLPGLTSYYRGYLRTSSEITSIHRLFNPRLRAGYTWHFRNGKSLGAHYSAAWTSYPDPRPLRMFENGVDVTYFF